jgi:two-component system cell cycle sensor histidine kinase/response regulator CckA
VKPAPDLTSAGEIPRLIETLVTTERRLVELTGGEVDAVTGAEGHMFLLQRAQEQLRHSEAVKQAAILNALPAHIALLDGQGVIVSVNDAWQRFDRANSSPGHEHGVGHNYLAICDQARGANSGEAGRVAGGIRAVLDGSRKHFSIEYPCHAPGERRWFELMVSPLLENPQHGVVVMHVNITERMRVAEVLQASEQRFRALFDQASVGVAQSDAVTGRYLQVNRRFCEIVGRPAEAMVGLTFADITHAKDMAESEDVVARLRAGLIREYTQEKRYVKAGREDVWARVTISAMWPAGRPPDFFIVVAQDITHRKQLEDQLRQAHKMEAMGTLAGGIAHDFNNILTAIGGYTELARMKLTDNPGVKGHLDSVIQAVKRAADLIRQILAFSREQPLERRLITLQPIVAECAKLLRVTLPGSVDLELVSAEDAPPVLADETQVLQVLMNLGTNASQALGGRPGRIQLKIENFLVEAAHAAAEPQLRAGYYARVSVSDTGGGMSPETQRRIFEPFFTTKAPGKGTGLGLAVVHGIMDSHDGLITVESHLGEGTTFHLYFPAHVPEAGGPSSAITFGVRGHGEKILLVDDESIFIEVGRIALAGLGYEVEAVMQPAAALELVRANPGRFALVITDQAMPGMTGLQLAAELRTIRPDLPIVLTTGYSLALTMERIHAAGVAQLLLKPTTARSLGASVHAALSGQPISTHVSNPPY